LISYVLPTRDRPAVLAATLERLGRLPPGAHAPAGGGEVIVVDNASAPPARVPPRLPNGLPVRLLRLEQNQGAAARNLAVREAAGAWIVMLDDDSAPLDAGHVAAACEAGPDLAAFGGEILLPDGSREAGGLPEVFVGCGAAVRRDAFLDAGGYDPDFGFYVEEYDLCARLLAAGWRVAHDWRLRVLHGKVASGRDMDLILERLVRNNGWVALRYAPPGEVERELDELMARYAQVAARERAAAGFARGLRALRETARAQPARPLPPALYDRFSGRAAAADHLGRAAELRGARVALIEPGRSAWVVRRVLLDLGARVVEADADADVLVVGTLSPGPMLDGLARRRLEGRPVLAAWMPGRAEAGAGAPAGSASMGLT
jgi:GT2 family glycosyltransferase